MPPVQGLDTPACSFPGMREWLLILPIFSRLYTSVIPRNPEINDLKVSWSTDLSPTAMFDPPDSARMSHGDTSAGEGVPGVVG